MTRPAYITFLNFSIRISCTKTKLQGSYELCKGAKRCRQLALFSWLRSHIVELMNLFSRRNKFASMLFRVFVICIKLKELFNLCESISTCNATIHIYGRFRRTNVFLTVNWQGLTNPSGNDTCIPSLA